MNKDELDHKTTERHIQALDEIVRGIGSMAMEYWGGATEKRAEAALEYLASIARSMPYQLQKAEEENQMLRDQLTSISAIKNEEKP